MPNVTGPADRTASVINFILGIWVLISPFVLRVSNFRIALWNNVIVGIIIIAFSATRAWGGRYQSTGIGWVNFILGIWLIISPFVIGFRTSPALVWNNIIAGIVVAVVSALSATRSPSGTEPPLAS